MKFLPLFTIALALLAGPGCSTVPEKTPLAYIQRALDALLPPDFVGDIVAEHNNPYFNFEIRAGNVHRTPAGWTFSWLVYKRKGFSNGGLRLGEIPKGL